MNPLVLNRNDYRDKVLACWIGKNIGGTLGAPFEWRRQINDVSFYAQKLGGDPLPNDDLDIQLLWQVSPSADGYMMSLTADLGATRTLAFTFQTERVTRSMNRCVLEITIEGRPTVMLVPIALLNGNLDS